MNSEKLQNNLREELEMIWQAHKSVGIEGGSMRLYSETKEEGPWRPKEEGLEFWFSYSETEQAIEEITKYYNNGAFPNTALLLDPVVYDYKDGKGGEAIGSGIIWATALCIGSAEMKKQDAERINGLGGFAGSFKRGENEKAGLKMIAFSDKILKPEADGTVKGCKALYNVANIKSDNFSKYYLLSGLGYLSAQGSYEHREFENLFNSKKAPLEVAAIKALAVDAQYLVNAETCWEAYERYQTLYDRFGVDVPNLERNLKYFNLCARDFELLDATGPARGGSEEQFQFIVPGWLPRGAITLIAGSGGTGKSSISHNLAVKAAIDYLPGEAPPMWLDKPVNMEACGNGLCVYFSGEDGPAIVNSRAEAFDPQKRAQRLMMQRTNFGLNKAGEPASFAEFIHKLSKMPNVPLLVIDPARKYLTGDEDDSEVVSNFFEAIEEFAITKNAAVLVVHHLAKGAKPQNYKDILDCLRGSQVFIDRPRVVIGMYREGPYTIVGLSKNNIPPALGTIQGERVFVRDAKSLDLVQLPGAEGIRMDSLSDEEMEEIKNNALKGKK